jgi:hypothetical protein
MKLIAAKEWNKVFYRDGLKHRIKVQAELVHLGSNLKPHFSITGEVQYQAKNNRWMDDSCGAIHEETLEHFPELQPLVDIHLADDQGVPMHAYANAGYWAGHTKWHPQHLPTLARHLGTTLKQAEEMVDYVEHYWGELDEVHTPEMAWKDACSHFCMQQQWKIRAKEALAMLNLVQPSEVAS